MTKKHNFICFDMDGTLLETHLDIASSINSILRENGLNEIPAEIQRGFRHFRLKPFVMDCLNYLGVYSVDLAIKVYDAHCENYKEFMLQEGKPFDGIPEVLAALKESGRSISVLTAKPKFFAEQELAHWFPSIEFDFIHGAEIGTAKKPRKEFLNPFLEKFNPKLEEIIYIGDTYNDYLFAQNAGIDFVGVTWGYDNDKEMARNANAVLCHSPAELLNIL
ncbi:MAG: HAD family hydrolase [Oscillospiraceae bacterium]|nr:HAD family hydrolase [Oscillospiraceae bacterium]